MDLALFDFDGTITDTGTYPEFVGFVVRPTRRFLATPLLAPVIAAYRLGLLSDEAVRRAISRAAFFREDASRIRELGQRFAEEVLPGVVRPDALARIRWHQTRGDRVVVVSGSLSAYLEPWCKGMSLDVICTQLEERQGRLTGRYLGGDCCGAEKASRILRRYPLLNYSSIYAYGDTDEDRQMLGLASRKFFRWVEVAEVPPSSAQTRRGDYRKPV